MSSTQQTIFAVVIPNVLMIVAIIYGKRVGQCAALIELDKIRKAQSDGEGGGGDGGGGQNSQGPE